MSSISSKSEVFEFPGGGGVTYDLRWPFSNSNELFQSKVMGENLVWIGWAFQELSFEFSVGGGGRNPILGGLHVTCNAHFRTWPSYSSQKSYVKIWLGFVLPFKSYRVHKHFSGGRNPLLWRVTFDLRCPFPNSDELFQSKVMCENRRYVNFEGGGRPPIRGGYMWPAMLFSNLAEVF